MATLQQIKDAIDARLITVFNNLTNRQNTFFGNRNKYFQGLRTHSSLPSEGNTAVADQLDSRPNYQTQTWRNAGIGSFNEAFALEVHQYNGPNGMGWCAIITVSVNGFIWTKVKDCGVEPHRNSGWTRKV